MNNISESQHILELSRELLDDIELDRLPSDKLLLKVNRLARLAGTEEIRGWLDYELRGYNSRDDLSLRYMTITGRWTDLDNQKGYYGSLAVHEQSIETLKARIDATKINNIEGDWAHRVSSDTRNLHATLGNQIGLLVGVRSRVLGLMHTFISGIYYEKQFADLAETTFESYKLTVDALIAEKAGSVLNKIPSVVLRLQEGDSEAISQALATCRRILESFADAIFPPTDGTFELGGNHLSLGASKHQNRLNVYVAQRTASSSRRTRLRQNLSNLFDRVSTGVHAEVNAEEALSLFLNIYLFLGEISSLKHEVDEAGPA